MEDQQRKKDTQNISLKFDAYCDLTSAKADLSRDAGKILTLSETVAALVQCYHG